MTTTSQAPPRALPQPGPDDAAATPPGTAQDPAGTAPPGGRAADLVARHREVLDEAVRAAAERRYWSRYPESPSPRTYGETAAADGLAAYEAHLGGRYQALAGQGATTDWVGEEVSPYGPALGVTYPHADDLDALLGAVTAAVPAWRDAGHEVRAAVCVEVLDRINRRSFELANAVMHTSGQPFVMAFQAGGAHAQDRALEAVATALAEQRRVPERALWEKPLKGAPVRMEKRYRVVPRGVGLVIGCSTFPTWNSYPGLFADLATGNGVVVKPHPRAVLPLAITVEVCREVLAEAGFDPDLVVLAAEGDQERRASDLALHPAVGVVDYTGSPGFGTWLERHVPQAVVYTEKAGLNTVVLDSTDDVRGMLANLAFSLVLYSGQMCTAPQNVYLPRDGIGTDEGHLPAEEVVRRLADAVRALTDDDARAVQLLGAAVSPDVVARADGAGERGALALPSRAVAHPDWPDAVVRTPALVRVDAADSAAYEAECFGPVAFVVTTASTQESLERFETTVREHGGMTALVHSTSDEVLAAAEEAALAAGVSLSVNLTDGVYVNQSAAFSDLHGTGANPAANAALTDAHYVAGRFRVVQVRRHV